MQAFRSRSAQVVGLLLVGLRLGILAKKKKTDSGTTFGPNFNLRALANLTNSG